VAASHAAREQTHSCEGADRHTPGPSFAPSNCRVVGHRLDSQTTRHFNDRIPETAYTRHWQQRLRQEQFCRRTWRADPRTSFRSRFDYWKDDGFGAKQDEDMPRQKIADLAATQRWVIEGVYGSLAEVAVPRATAFMWLDVPWDVCREGLSRVACVAAGPRPILQSSSDGQKLTGIARRRHP
jgi:hypothetical protein